MHKQFSSTRWATSHTQGAVGTACYTIIVLFHGLSSSYYDARELHPVPAQVRGTKRHAPPTVSLLGIIRQEVYITVYCRV